MKTIKVINERNDVILLCRVADTFFSRFCGLMFQKEISPDSGLILSESSESVLNSSIHMLFMRFNIAVIWLNKENIVVCKTLAKKWHPAYFSVKPANQIIETHTSNFVKFNIGDHIQIKSM